jgi:2-polyprenyl-3-methyl-5-hydroxy-6-metoxy-1,4-benzoquinol methylase
MKTGRNDPNRYTTLELRRIALMLYQLVKYADLFGFGEDFKTYFRRMNTVKGAEVYLRRILHLLRIARAPIYGKCILDAGCGFGMTSLVLRLLGAKWVVGIDLNRERLDVFCRMLHSLPFAIDGVSMYNMSAANMGFRGRSFDMILVNEVISHYSDMGRFFSESKRILTPGGVLIVSDGNNYSNPLIRRKRIKLWQTLEQGTDRITVWGHRIEKSLKTQREEIIALGF